MHETKEKTTMAMIVNGLQLRLHFSEDASIAFFLCLRLNHLETFFKNTMILEIAEGVTPEMRDA
jgi:hypothetical protein